MPRPEQNGMTCNALMVLLDCYRGFHRMGHTGTLDADLRYLKSKGLIREGKVADGFDWTTTDLGNSMCLNLINLAKTLAESL